MRHHEDRDKETLKFNGTDRETMRELTMQEIKLNIQTEINRDQESPNSSRIAI